MEHTKSDATKCTHEISLDFIEHGKHMHNKILIKFYAYDKILYYMLTKIIL